MPANESFLETFNKVIWSRDQQTNISTAQTANFLCDVFDSGVTDEPPVGVMTDAARANGKEAPTNIQVAGHRFRWNFSHQYPDIDTIISLMAYLFGFQNNAGGTNETSLGGGIIRYELTNPSNTFRTPSFFTLVRQYGERIEAMRSIGNALTGLTITVPSGATPGGFVSISGSIEGSGNVLKDPLAETIAALDTIGSLTLAEGNLSEEDGATAAGWAAAIESVWCDLDDDGIFETEVDLLVQTGKTVVIIDPPGIGGVTRNYRVIARRETPYTTWITLLQATDPTTTPSPFRFGDIQEIAVGGVYDNTNPVNASSLVDFYTDGYRFPCEFEGVQINFGNPVQWRECAGATYTPGQAHQGFRRPMGMTITISKQMADNIFRVMGDDIEEISFSLYLRNQNYLNSPTNTIADEVCWIFPRCKGPHRTAGKSGEFMTESYVITPLEPDVAGDNRCVFLATSGTANLAGG